MLLPLCRQLNIQNYPVCRRKRSLWPLRETGNDGAKITTVAQGCDGRKIIKNGHMIKLSATLNNTCNAKGNTSWYIQQPLGNSRYFGSNAGIGQPFPLIDVILSQHYQAQQHVDMAAYVRHSYGPFLWHSIMTGESIWTERTENFNTSLAIYLKFTSPLKVDS